MTDLVFLDTETTGLGPDDEVWEFAAIRRRFNAMGYVEARLHIHIEHDIDKAAELPEKFFRDYSDRYEKGVPQSSAGEMIGAFLAGKPHLVGANPAFDAGMLARLLALHGRRPPWHYHLIDLEAVTLGYLLGRGEHVDLPWRSDDLAARVGAPTTDADGFSLYDRHTAMGDVLWCRDWWDALVEDGAS
ncbi:exonuclease [Gordonia phage Faith5x5]|nr:exonuclease [Gordonia phage Faith5x5]